MTDWKLKIKAFLYTPPDAALIPEDGLSKRRNELISIAFPEDPDIPNELLEANSIAWALDRPPGIERASVNFARNPKIKHPLFSGEEKALWSSDLEKDVREEAKEAVDKAINQLREKYQDDKLFFLALWRLLPEKLSKEESKIIGPGWEIMPADPRLPDSVWIHASATSAVASAMPEPAFLLFTISSIQDYVSVARRTQDLWMGSFLLSYLIWEAIKAIIEGYGPDVILSPALRGQPLVDRWLIHEKGLELEEPSEPELKIANFPNFVTAILPKEKAAEAAKEACEAVRSKRNEICNRVREYLESALKANPGLFEEVEDPNLLFRLWNLSGDEDWKAIWKRQCKDFLSAEVFWVVCPWGKDPEKVLKATEKYLPEDTKDKPDYWFNRFKSLYDKAKSSRTDIGLAYPLLLGRTRQLLTARKNLRHFRQSEERGEPGHKCSMCGVREALHPEWWRIDEKGGHYHELREFWSALTKVTKPKKLAGRIRRGDRLCAVCAVKRLALEAHFAESLGFDHHMFPSTSTVATATFQMEVVENIEQLQEEVGKYVEAMKPIMEEITYPSSSLPLLKAKSEEYPNSRIKQLLEDFLQIDGDWFFEESFDIESVEWEYGRRYRRRIEQKKLQEELQKKLSEAKEALKELVKAAGELGIGKPNPYYAMICMDGDHIGDWQTGRKNLEFEKLLHQDALNELRDIAGERRPMGPGTQGALCTALGNFALKIVRPLVEKEHCGKLIYAGGEDVLAFAPLRDVPGILEGLQEKLVINFLQKDGEILLLPGEKASISAGVVIAHRSQPLSQVVEESRKALKEHAKEMLGRDALAFHLMRRSGESTKIGVCWRFPEDARADPPMSILKDLIQWFRGFREGKLSPRLAWDMDQEAGGLRALTEVDPREARLRWLINRHTDPKTPQDEARALTKKMTGLLRGYTRFINERGLSDELNAWELTKDFILVAHFIAKEP